MTLNHMWTGNHKPSKRYTEWKREADRFLQLQLANGLKLPTPAWAGDFVIETRLNPPDRRRRDLDNVAFKGVLDRLTVWKVIEDDSQCVRLISLRDRNSLTPGTAMVTVELLDGREASS